MQYVSKCEVAFNVRLNNHRKDSKKKDTLLVCTYFQNQNHIFQQDAEFILIEQITKMHNAIEALRFILKKQENFWNLNLCALYPDGLNQELNS